MLAGVIFDFDGVVVDSHPVHLEAWKTFFNSLGQNIHDEYLAFVLEGAKKEDILRHFLGDLTLEDIKLYSDEKERLFKERASNLRLTHGFAGFMEQVDAAGLPSVVATSGSRKRVEESLEHFGLRSRFRAVVTGEDVAKGKPDPSIFYLAARALHIKAENILVCEDAVSGVTGAKKATMKCLAIASNGREAKLKQAGADLVVADFTQVKLGDVSKFFT